MYNSVMSDPEYFDAPLSNATIGRLVDAEFTDMVKFVVDLDRGVICVGGGFHSDERDDSLGKRLKAGESLGSQLLSGST